MKLTRKKRREAKARAAKRTIQVQKPRTAESMWRRSGRTYIQLGDGFEFVIERPHEIIVHLLKLSATTVYDMVENEWIKYRSTLYTKDGKLHCKFFSNRAEKRSTDFAHVPVMDYPELVAAGYMYDAGEGAMARFRFDYPAYKRRVLAAQIIFDDAKA